MKFKYIPVKSKYFKPSEGYDNLVKSIISVCKDDDLVFISETPISTIEGNLVDESQYKYGIVSYLITELWCRYFWGYILGPLFGVSQRTIKNLRDMPIEARNHKEFIYRKYGLKYALQPTAEAGVDLSNVPGTYVSLLPENPEKSARKIKEMVCDKSGKNVEVIVMDTDPTYKIRNTYFTTLPQSLKDIYNDTGIFGYLLRFFSKKIGVTILASTVNIDLDRLIYLANCCENCQRINSDNFFETVYNMKETFSSSYDDVNIEMLCSVCHIPAVLVRKDTYL